MGPHPISVIIFDVFLILEERHGPINWPPGSSNLISLDSLICEYVENTVSTEKFYDIQPL
jgi:hypothetical protein